jgi:hypothetical protein
MSTVGMLATGPTVKNGTALNVTRFGIVSNLRFSLLSFYKSPDVTELYE